MRLAYVATMPGGILRTRSQTRALKNSGLGEEEKGIGKLIQTRLATDFG